MAEHSGEDQEGGVVIGTHMLWRTPTGRALNKVAGQLSPRASLKNAMLLGDSAGEGLLEDGARGEWGEERKSVLFVSQQQRQRLLCFQWSYLIGEIGLRILLAALFPVVANLPVSTQLIRPEEWHHYAYPFTPKSTITQKALYAWLLLGTLIPLTVTCVTYILSRQRIMNPPRHHQKRAAPYGFAHFFSDSIRLGLVQSMAYLATWLVTNLVKAWVGRPRPDFLARCQPLGFDLTNLNLKAMPLLPVCTNSNQNVLADARVSFPSGHASFSAAVFSVMALYFFLEFPKPLRWKKGGVNLILAIASLLPSVYCAATRVIDYRHHVQDVVVGWLLGATIACATWYIYYSDNGLAMSDQVKGAALPSRGYKSPLAADDWTAVKADEVPKRDGNTAERKSSDSWNTATGGVQ